MILHFSQTFLTELRTFMMHSVSANAAAASAFRGRAGARGGVGSAYLYRYVIRPRVKS